MEVALEETAAIPLVLKLKQQQQQQNSFLWSDVT